jgi:hypothetical protein
MAKKSVGKNIEYTLVGSILTLIIDTSKDFGPSASGKTILVASSQGNQEIGDVRVGVNVYRYKDEKPAKVGKK